MTNKELVDILKTIEDLPVFSVRAPEGSKLPYLVLVFGATDNFAADDHVISKKQAVGLELYTVRKDESIEAKVEDCLDENFIPWDKDEAFDDGEQFYINYYDITRR